MEEGSSVGGLCGGLCFGILGQFFSTRTWGANWTCWDKCCRCESCWDAGEFDPADRPGGANAIGTQKDGADAKATTQQPEEGDAVAPPAYKAADPMSTVAPASADQTNVHATQPQATVASTGAIAASQSGNTPL